MHLFCIKSSTTFYAQSVNYFLDCRGLTDSRLSSQQVGFTHLLRHHITAFSSLITASLRGSRFLHFSRSERIGSSLLCNWIARTIGIASIRELQQLVTSPSAK